MYGSSRSLFLNVIVSAGIGERGNKRTISRRFVRADHALSRVHLSRSDLYRPSLYEIILRAGGLIASTFDLPSRISKIHLDRLVGEQEQARERAKCNMHIDPVSCTLQYHVASCAQNVF